VRMGDVATIPLSFFGTDGTDFGLNRKGAKGFLVFSGSG